ncbi:retrovirus-related pol polyprotein from transposon TNT 1-94 [Tanacetum coccineum]
MEAPKELPKVSLVNESLKKLKFHLAKLDNVVKIRTTPDARTKGKWGFEHTKDVFNNEMIPFLKSLKDIFNVFDKDLLNEIMEVQTVFDQMEAGVQQSLVEKQCLEIAKKELLLENDRLLQQIMSQDVLLTVFKEQFDSIKKTRARTKEHSDSLIDKLNLKSIENEDLKAQIQDKVFVITSLKNDLRKVKGKEIVDVAAQIPYANTIVPGMFKLNLEPLAHRITSANVVPLKKTTSHSVETQKPELKVYSRKPKTVKNLGSSKKANIVESKKANHSEPNNDWGSNATYILSSSSLVMTDTFRFRNDQITRIMGYGDYQLGNVTISRVYYIEGLGHNLFSVGSRDTNLYTISLDDMIKTSSICLLSKASKTKSWKKQKSSHQPKAKDTNQEKLYLLHMDLCGLMHVASINGKRYILVIVDDYSRFTYVRFLRTKDEAPEAIIKCIKNIQVCLNPTVRNVPTDNGTEFVNQILREFYENVGISHQTSVTRTP